MTARNGEGPSDPEDLRGFDDFDLSLGDIMRGERATLGKSLLDVQRELKIKATYIAAIENSDPTAFETPGFIAGYVRSYARYLGLDPEWAYKTFCDEGKFEVAHGMSAQASARRPSRDLGQTATVTGPRDPFKEPSVSFVPSGSSNFQSIEPRAIGSMLVLLVLIGGIGYGGWSVLQEIQKVQFTPVDQAPGVLSETEEIGGGGFETAGAGTPFDPATAEGTSGDAPSVEAFDRLYRPQALDVPVLTARDGPIATLDPSRVGTMAPAAAPDEASASLAEARQGPEPIARDGETLFAVLDPEFIGPIAPATAAFGTPSDVESAPVEGPPAPPVQVVEAAEPEVVLFAVRPAWVRVRAADGSVIFEKILDPGEEFTVPLTETPPTLRAGNAQSVFFRVDGVTYGPAGTTSSVVRDVALGQTELTNGYDVADLSRDADLARYVDLSGGAQ
ncbi:MAG: RodZ domain-containing protein [Pseudomonadota bacterium]